MNKRQEIPPREFNCCSFDIWSNKWFLLTAGDFSKGDFNTMTVGWGSFGTMWADPFAMVVVRPQRHTFSFMEKYDSFTLSLMPDSHRNALSVCGSKSGRDCDKMKLANITPVKSKKIAAPGIDEAILIIECRKSYFSDMNPAGMLEKEMIPDVYPQNDFHRIYFGEILHIEGLPGFATEHKPGLI